MKLPKRVQNPYAMTLYATRAVGIGIVGAALFFGMIIAIWTVLWFTFPG